MVSQAPRPTVVHVIGALVAGGAERFVSSLLMEFRRRNFEPSLWVLSSKTDRAGVSMRDALLSTGVQVSAGPTERLGLRTVLWYRKQLSTAPSIVHLHTPNTELAHCLATLMPSACGSPAVYRTIHNTKLPSGVFNGFAYRRNRVKASIACSVASEKKYRQFISGNVVSIQNGININLPPASTQERLAARQKLGLDGAHYHFICIGKMGGETLPVAQKAHDILLKAWAVSGLGELGASLHLLGDGNLRPELESLFGARRGIHFHGVRDDVMTWLQAADCYVMPSRFEGLPIAAIEAVSAGLPCLFSDIEPLRELGAPLALWSPVNDAETLSDGMRQMFRTQPHVQASDIADFRDRFSIERVASRYLDVYGIKRQ